MSIAPPASLSMATTQLLRTAVDAEPSIPVIDIAPLLSQSANGEDCSEVISALSAAVFSHGIFAIVGHGIPPNVVYQALAAAKDSLRSGGPAENEQWQELERGISTRLPGEMTNFTPSGLENLGRFYNGEAKAPTESVAKFTVWPPCWDLNPAVAERQRNLWPSTAHGQVLREALEEYFAEVQRVSDVLHSGLARALGKPGSFIEDMLAPFGNGVLRALHYQGEDGAESEAPAMAAHKDLGTTTFLVSDAPGLQFQPRDSDDWVDVVVPPDALVVNLGEFFEIWTRGMWRATLHRVAASGRRGRTSLAFFANQAIPHPSDGSSLADRVIAPIEDIVGAEVASRELEWAGIRAHLASDARKTVAWPSFFFERVQALMGNLKKAQDDVAQVSKGGA
eukprot:TRINITY_DN21258_c0_g1_i1.p1 TRINITY_DN21258_c0_g1~~TRINITY_DN21258_c0_g1_i1.p1  ORF type:complete len:394 (+),score=69.86 TRINITY_DN21258_c0_g1_i1:30-1211(+)